MKSFKERLDEATEKLVESTADLKRLARPETVEKLSSIKLDKKAKEWHDNAFGYENHIEHELQAEVPPAVVDHVSSKGGEIDETGHQVKLKSGRVVPTSKFLGKSNAPKHIMTEYEHHLRHASENGNTKLVISKHPGEVASSSTGTNWDSCMNLDKDNLGEHSANVNDDIKHGTMIAMHLHKDSKPNKDGEYDAKDILGRRLIKRHDTDDGKVVYHQEERSYGQFPKSAIAKVEAFTKKNNHTKHVVALKHEDLYDDDNKTAKLEDSATPENISNAMDHKNPAVQIAVAGHKNADENVIKKAYNSTDYDVNMAGLKNPSAPDSFLRRVIKTGSGHLADLAASNNNLSREGIHDALNHESKEVRDSAINHNNPNFDKSHFDKAMELKSSKLLDAPFSHFITPEHLDKFLDSIGSTAGAAAGHRNASLDNLHKAFNHSNKYVRAAAVANPNAPQELLDKGMASEYPEVRKGVLNNPNVKKEHIELGLKDDYPNISAIARKLKDNIKHDNS